MASKLTEEQLEQVRTWASQGVDLNGIQKRLAAECGVHLTYMEVRFLLLDYGIEMATAAEVKPSSAAPPAAELPVAPEAPGDAPGAPGGVSVSLDDLQLPGTLISGKASFPSGGQGAWFIDQSGRLGWSELSAKPTPEELQDFQKQLMQLLRGAL